MLFGDPERVRGSQREVRIYMGTAAPGSPADLAGMGPSPQAFPDRRHKCAKCGVEAPAGKEVKKYQKCMMATYCSRECQRAHWRKHKKVCKTIAAKRDGTEETWQSEAGKAVTAKALRESSTAYRFDSGKAPGEKPAFGKDDSALRIQMLLDFKQDELIVSLHFLPTAQSLHMTAPMSWATLYT
jgi:MYND finger